MKMNRRSVKKILPLLSLLNKLSAEERKTLLTYINEEACEGLCECILNGLANKKIAKQDRETLKAKLSGNRKVYNYLLKPGNSVKRKLKLLPKTGSDLNWIIEVVSPLLSNLFNLS